MPTLGPTTNHEEIRLWAESRAAVPTELLPHRFDGEPAALQIMASAAALGREDVRLISWEEFFCKFDELALTLVYDDGLNCQNEILQIEERSPYRHPNYKGTRLQN